MIKEVEGNLFESGADILVNAVNCVGVMGGGIALAFKTKYPEYFNDYYLWCQHRFFEPGLVKPYLDESGTWIISAATKAHWREDSKYGWIESCIEGLYQCFDGSLVKTKEMTIAMPALGCGLGGLKYNIVRDIIFETGKRLPYKEVLLYKPL
jgi:O-acetyl-ADP-ribose deacetylase (regulator of RNase III)